MKVTLLFDISHIFDYFNILVLAKSIADTNTLSEGFFVIKRGLNVESQLFGYIYYQVIAVWLHILNAIHIIRLDYLFDSKSFRPGDYMSSFTQIRPELYQLAMIKWIQFVYDAIFLFFITRLSDIVTHHNKRAKLACIFFWAFNPILIYSAYVPFQSDLAMIAFLTAGVYFAVKVHIASSNSIISRNVFAMLLCFAIGALIKQVPLLFVIPCILLLSNNLKAVVVRALVFSGLYLLLSQPWNPDSAIVRQFFLTSTESTALFHFSLNHVPVFIVLYILLQFFIVAKRRELLAIQAIPIFLGAIILSILFICEDTTYLYAQFNIWLFPFLMMLVLIDKRYALFFIGPIIGFYKWIIMDGGAVSGSLHIALGEPLGQSISYPTIVSSFIKFELLDSFLAATFITSNIALGISSIATIFGRPITHGIPLNLWKVTAMIIIIYTCFFVFDYTLKSRNVLFVSSGNATDNMRLVSPDAVSVQINNPDQQSINSVQIDIKRDRLVANEKTIMTVIDKDTGDVIEQKQFSDAQLPAEFDQFIYFFNKPTSIPRIMFTIRKVGGSNNILLRTTSEHANPPMPIGDRYYTHNHMKLDFPGPRFVISVRGIYGATDVLDVLQYHWSTSPVFYSITFSIMLLSSMISVTLIIFAIKQVKRSRIELVTQETK